MMRRRLNRVASDSAWAAGDPERYAESLRNPAAFAKQVQETARIQSVKRKGVGYGRPPTDSWFKPGQSGNPLGRPKGSKNLRNSVERIFTNKITIREGGKVRKVTRLEAVLLTNLNQALKGDQRAIRAVHVISTALGLMEERPQRLEVGDLSSFTMEELEEFRRLLKKASAKVVPT